MKSLLRQAPAARPLFLLRLRFQTGQPVILPEAFDAVGLAERERHVVRQRLAGRSYGQIAGRSCTRQRVQQVERIAVARLGLSLSIAQAVHASQRADQAQEWADRSKLTSPADLHGDGPTRRQRKPSPREMIHAKLDRLADRWLTADAAGRVRLSAEAHQMAEELAAV
jgi:hypothetical protein